MIFNARKFLLQTLIAGNLRFLNSKDLLQVIWAQEFKTCIKINVYTNCRYAMHLINPGFYIIVWIVPIIRGVLSLFSIWSFHWNCAQTIQTIILWKQFVDDRWRSQTIHATQTIAIVWIEMRSIRTTRTISIDWEIFYGSQFRRLRQLGRSKSIPRCNVVFRVQVDFKSKCQTTKNNFLAWKWSSFARVWYITNSSLFWNIILTQNLCLLVSFVRHRFFKIATHCSHKELICR